MATFKQKAVVAKLLENAGNVSKTMKEVGYAPGYCKNPQDLTDSKGFQEAAKPLLEQLEEERQAILDEMRKKRNKANYGTLTGAFDTVTKNIQLLSGKATESATIQIITKIPRPSGDTI